MSDDELLSSRDLQRLLNISAATAWRWRRDHIGPPAVVINGDTAKRPTFRYWRSAVETWLKQQEQS